MSLILKTPSTKMIAANRANALKSKGPRTELGKKHSSRNAGKHLVYASVLLPRMKELGENPADFEELHGSLRHAFQPQDAFEETLVRDMAEIRWRLARLRRAEAGLLAAQRQKFRLDRELHAAREKMGSGASAVAKSFLQGEHGLGGAAQSFVDCEDVLSILQLLRLQAMQGIFGEEERKLLDLVFGKSTGVEVRILLRLFDKCSVHPAGERSEEQEDERRCLIEKLDAQIEHFQKLGQLFAARDSEVVPCMEEGQLLLKQEDLDKIVRYEAHLERQFERKLQQLVAWRRARGEGLDAQASDDEPGAGAELSIRGRS